MAPHHLKSSALSFVVWIVLTVVVLASDGPHYLPHQLQAIANPPAKKPQNATAGALSQAKTLVDAAVKQQSIYNQHRVANPRRNSYQSRRASKSTLRQLATEPSAPVLDDALKAAAKLLAEHDAAQQAANGTLHRQYSEFADLPKPLKFSSHLGKRDQSTPFWASQVDHGLPSMGANPSYPVYRDVTDPKFGAKGDGVTDDTNAINAAIAYGNNCGQNCLSSTIKGTFIYFPPGTYLISSPINAYYYSQLVGDPNNMPIIKTSQSFVGLGAIQSDVYIPNASGGEWYIEQSNFYRQIRNILIDITQTTTASAAGLHWQVAQATSLQNVYITASRDPATTQMGMYTENGSGGFMSDCSIVGGKYGIYGGNQQYTVRGFQITDQSNASICLIWDWGWTWSQMSIARSPIGIQLMNQVNSTGQDPGSIFLMDTEFNSVGTAIKADDEKFTILDTSIITLQNIIALNVSQMVSYGDGQIPNIPNDHVEFMIIGNVEDDGSFYGQFTDNLPTPSPQLLDFNDVIWTNPYFHSSRPQFENFAVSSVVNVKSFGAMGNGQHDDTAAIRSALAQATQNNIIYFPPGSYIITSTIVIPTNANIVGQVWSQLVASGSYFANMNSPKPMIQVGLPGQVGNVVFTDILFTSIGALPGLIMVEWNIQAATQGSSGMWDTHFRVGGAYGTQLQVAQCPSSSPIQQGCIAASLMLHVTNSSSGYFENVWAWVADHDIDDPQNAQITIAVGRGMLIESQGPVWMYGTASEHSMMYQYNFANSVNTLAGMIQTESAYFQFADNAESPGPFNASVGLFMGDPMFPDATCSASPELCNFGWAVMAQNTTNLTIAGAGLYSWFDNYAQTCVDTQNCQQRLVNDFGDNGGMYLWNLVTIGSVEMVSNTGSGEVILAKNNTQALAHPFWSALAGYMDDSEPTLLSCLDTDTDPSCWAITKCDYSRSFDTFEALAAAAGSFPAQCNNYYAMGVLHSILDGSLVNYTDANSGYDDVYSYYVEYIQDSVQGALQSFMAFPGPTSPAGPGNKYFNCTIKGYGPTTTQQCPFTWQQIEGASSYDLTYTMLDSKGFFADLQANYSIDQSWIYFGDIPAPTGPGNVSPPKCHRDDCAADSGPKQGISQHNVPQSIPKSQINPQNPKDIITKALPSVNNITATLIGQQLGLATQGWNGSSFDMLQVYSMPVLMIQQAVASMEQAKATAQQYEAAKTKQLVIEILGAVFAVLPFLADLAPALEVIGGALNIVAGLGNVALSIEGMVTDPSSVPMDIIGLLGAYSPRSPREMGDLAAARRGMTDAEIANVGADFKAKNTEFQSTVKQSCRI